MAPPDDPLLLVIGTIDCATTDSNDMTHLISTRINRSTLHTDAG